MVVQEIKPGVFVATGIKVFLQNHYAIISHPPLLPLRFCFTHLLVIVKEGGGQDGVGLQNEAKLPLAPDCLFNYK